MRRTRARRRAGTATTRIPGSARTTRRSAWPGSAATRCAGETARVVRDPGGARIAGAREGQGRRGGRRRGRDAGEEEGRQGQGPQEGQQEGQQGEGQQGEGQQGEGQ